MERPLLNDKDQYPDDAVLAKHLGKAKSAWNAFAAAISAQFGGASLEWRYYHDGKAWLCKLARKKNTICWISIWDRSFKTTFYFTEKSDRDIETLPIPSDLKQSYRACASIGKLKSLTIDVRSKKTLEDVLTVAKYKDGLKSRRTTGR